MSEETKESAFVPKTEQLINCLDEHIRKIVKEEINRSAWKTFSSLYPQKFVQRLEEALQKQFPSLK